MTSPRERQRRLRRPLHLTRRILRYAVLVSISLVVLVPIYLSVVTALLPPKYRLAYPPPLFPKEPTLDAFRLAIRRGSMLRYFVNSTVVSVAIAVGQVTTACFAAYALTFMRVPYRRTLFWFIIASGVVPAEAIVVGNFQTVVRLHWIDSYPALIVPFLASPLGVFLLTRAFRTVPLDLIGAARVDGCGHLRTLRHVVVPVARPTIAALAVIAFIGAWGQYLWPLLVTNRPDRRTLPIGLRSLASGELSSFTVLSAAAVLTMIPLAILLIVFQKQLVRGLTAGLADH